MGLRSPGKLQTDFRTTPGASQLRAPKGKTLRQAGIGRNGFCSNADLRHSRGRRTARCALPALTGLFGVPKLATFVLDMLLTRGRAVLHRRHPFTTRLKDRVGGDVQPVGVTRGRGDYCRTKVSAHDFSRGLCIKPFRGFSPSHTVRAEVPRGNKVAIHVGLVAVRARGPFREGDADGTNDKYQTSPSRGRLWLCVSARASDRGRSRRLQRGRLG